MPGGIRATVEFRSAGVCPMLDRSRSGGPTIESARSSVPTDGSPGVTDFLVAGELEEASELSGVFSHGPASWYRLDHGDGLDCPCEYLGRSGLPVVRYVARDGRLTVVFHAADYEELQRVIADLRERYSDVDIKRIVRSPAGEPPADSVLVDRGQLTARQHEVLETALDLGYFERPRGANATEVAGALGIDASTFSEHLAAAQRKLLVDVLEEGR